MDVNITGLDKMELLHRLWDRASQHNWFDWMDFLSESRQWNDKAIRKHLAKSQDAFNVYWCCGREICVDLRFGWANTTRYNKMYGQGVFEQIVASMR